MSWSEMKREGHWRPGEAPKLQFARPDATSTQTDAFTSPPLSEALVSRVHELLGARARPTTPQAQALAHFFSARAKNARPTLIAAETGSGKTLAYLLPMLQRLHETRERTEHADIAHVRMGSAPRIMPRAIILVPTHELARQITDVAKILCHDARHKLRVACSSKPGYVSSLNVDLVHMSKRAAMPPEESDVCAPISPDVLVTTPPFVTAYMHDLFSLANVQMLVADEADTLLDDSFQDSTLPVLRALPPSAQLVFVTATIPRSMHLLLDKTYPALDTLASPHLHLLPRRLRTMFVSHTGNRNVAVLRELFRVFTTPGCEDDQILIFRDENKGVNEMSAYLARRNVDHVRWTGDAPMRKTHTSATLKTFLAGPSEHYSRTHGQPKDEHAPRVLITTSVLSRGLDFGPRVRHIFLPDARNHGARLMRTANNNALELLHRAGRSARAGREGTIVIFDKSSMPGGSKVLINRRGKKCGVVRGQMDLLVQELKRPRRKSGDYDYEYGYKTLDRPRSTFTKK